MKIAFPLPHDGKTHMYCIGCDADGVQRVKRDGITLFGCPSCGKISERYIHIGDTLSDGKWWLADDGELWNESAGVFVRNPEGKYLFFERTAFPFGFTVPAGHVDNGEEADATATRELMEEVGVRAQNITHVTDTDIVGDSCIGGADAHRWHVYREDLPETIEVRVREEGERPVWLTLDEAKTKELPFAIRYLLDHHAADIEPKTA